MVEREADLRHTDFEGVGWIEWKIYGSSSPEVFEAPGLVCMRRLPSSLVWGAVEYSPLRMRLVHTHSEPEESSSTVPVFMLMAMGVRPLSCSCNVWRGRGAPPPRLPSLPEEPCDDTIPERQLDSLLWMRWILFFSLMGGKHFFFKMPEGKIF